MKHQVMGKVGNYGLAEQLLANKYCMFQSKCEFIDSRCRTDNASHIDTVIFFRTADAQNDRAVAEVLLGF
jgi:hypothetical protein